MGRNGCLITEKKKGGWGVACQKGRSEKKPTPGGQKWHTNRNGDAKGAASLTPLGGQREGKLGIRRGRKGGRIGVRGDVTK